MTSPRKLAGRNIEPVLHELSRRQQRLILVDSRGEQSQAGVMQDEVYNEIEKALNEGAPLVVATVASSRGSTPRKPGAKMAVRPDGSFCGTIGGGCGEAEVWQAAMDVLDNGKPRLVVVDLTESPEGEDKICGGIMEVFVERVV